MKTLTTVVDHSNHNANYFVLPCRSETAESDYDFLGIEGHVDIFRSLKYLNRFFYIDLRNRSIYFWMELDSN
jgi:hypothetical protein